MEQTSLGDRRCARILAPLGLFAIAFGVRALPFHGVFLDGRVLFFGSDAYYHMRRIAFSTVHFPDVLRLDPYINFPAGGQPIWSPPFDWAIAGVMRLFLGTLTSHQLEVLAAWIPPVLGATTTVALYCVARAHYGPAVALAAGAVLSVLSGHFWYSQVGFVDHHAAVALATTILLAAAMRFLALASRRPHELRGVGSGGIPVGLAMGASLLLWPGSLLHVALIESAFLATLLRRSEQRSAIAFARQLVWVHGVAFLLLAPSGLTTTWLEWSRFSPVVLSSFQPWYFGAATIFCAGCVVVWKRAPAGGSRARRMASAALVAGGLLAASAIAFPELSLAAGDAWEWMAKRDAFQAQVAESAPLFVIGGQFSLLVALTRLSAFALVAPLALVAVHASIRRRPHPAPTLLFLWWTFGLCAATIVQKRFMNSSSVALALLLVLFLHAVYTALPSGFRQRARWRRSLRVALAAATAVMLLPVASSYRFHAENLVAAWSGRSPRVEPGTLWQATVVTMANWLRTRTPPTSGWLDAAAKPEYGVLAPWTIGHIIEFEGRRPTVTDNFGDDIGRENFLLARRYYLGDEPAAAAILDRLRVRYVVAQAGSPYLGSDPSADSMFFSLFRHDGSGFDPEAGDSPRVAVPALERHRLVYESPPAAPAASGAESLFKVFEYVQGARVEGRAAAGARIRASLELRTNRGRALLYAAATTASAEGRYAIRLPYANEGSPPSVTVGDRYLLSCAGTSAALVIGEDAVQAGKRVGGPSLCGAPDR